MPGLYPVPEPLSTAYISCNIEVGQPRRLRIVLLVSSLLPDLRRVVAQQFPLPKHELHEPSNLEMPAVKAGLNMSSRTLQDSVGPSP